jgi:hypothetical protein
MRGEGEEKSQPLRQICRDNVPEQLSGGQGGQRP